MNGEWGNTKEWGNGMMEYWNAGKPGGPVIIPLFQYF